MTFTRTGAIVVRYINLFFTVVGLCVIGAGVYVLYFDEGPVNKDFLAPPCYFVIIFGVTISLTSYLGHLGLHYRITKGNLSAFKILCMYIFILLVLFAGEVVALDYTYSLILTLQSSLKEGDVPYPSLRGVEIYISKLFNQFFFDNTISQCNAVSNTVFWGFVDDYCPSEVHKQHCQKCFPYGVGTCPSDSASCYQSLNEVGPWCPYTVCRSGVLRYCIENLKIMGYSLIGLVAFEAVLIGTVLSLVCHFNSKKRRWSIDKGRRVMPLPQHLLPQEAVVADKPNDKPNDKPTAENPLHLDI